MLLRHKNKLQPACERIIFDIRLHIQNSHGTPHIEDMRLNMLTYLFCFNVKMLITHFTG